MKSCSSRGSLRDKHVCITGLKRRNESSHPCCRERLESISVTGGAAGLRREEWPERRSRRRRWPPGTDRTYRPGAVAEARRKTPVRSTQGCGCSESLCRYHASEIAQPQASPRGRVGIVSKPGGMPQQRHALLFRKLRVVAQLQVRLLEERVCGLCGDQEPDQHKGCDKTFHRFQHSVIVAWP
jgi:hypothetical protein